MSKEKKKEKKSVRKKLNIRQLSPDASIYKNSATIILRGKPIKRKDDKETKFLEFLSRAPISFDKDDV